MEDIHFLAESASTKMMTSNIAGSVATMPNNIKETCPHCGAKLEWEYSAARKYYCGTCDHQATGHHRSELCRIREEIQQGKIPEAKKRANKWRAKK